MAISIDEIEVATLYVVLEREIEKTKKYMASDIYACHESFVKTVFEDRFDRMVKLYARFQGVLYPESV